MQKRQKVVLISLVSPEFITVVSKYLLRRGYSENRDILSKSHIIDLELQTIFYNFDHSEFINLCFFGRYDLAIKLLASKIPKEP